MQRLVVCSDGESIGEPRLMPSFISAVSTRFLAHDQACLDERHFGQEWVDAGIHRKSTEEGFR